MTPGAGSQRAFTAQFMDVKTTEDDRFFSFTFVYLMNLKLLVRGKDKGYLKLA